MTNNFTFKIWMCYTLTLQLYNLILQNNKTNSDIYSLINLLSYNRIDSESLFLLSDLNEFTNWLSSIPNEAKNRVTLRSTQGEKCRARAMKLHSVFLRSQFHSRSSVRITFYNSHSVTSFISFSKFDNSYLWTTFRKPCSWAKSKARFFLCFLRYFACQLNAYCFTNLSVSME